MPDLSFAPRSAFAGILHDHGIDASGVVVADRSGTRVATVITPATVHADLNEKLALHGLALPQGPTHTGPGPVALVGLGPRRYLAVGDTSHLVSLVTPHAAVFDQTHGYALLRLHGQRVRATLAKGVSIDLHPLAFPVGAAASTSIAHIGAIFWRLPDLPDGSPVFEIAIFRSMAASFWHFLAASAGEFGLKVEAPR